MLLSDRKSTGLNVRTDPELLGKVRDLERFLGLTPSSIVRLAIYKLHDDETAKRLEKGLPALPAQEPVVATPPKEG